MMHRFDYQNTWFLFLNIFSGTNHDQWCGSSFCILHLLILELRWVDTLLSKEYSPFIPSYNGHNQIGKYTWSIPLHNNQIIIKYRKRFWWTINCDALVVQRKINPSHSLKYCDLSSRSTMSCHTMPTRAKILPWYGCLYPWIVCTSSYQFSMHHKDKFMLA